VISGETQAVEEAMAKLKEAGAKRALLLPVNGAFHSPLMQPAQEELAKLLIQQNSISLLFRYIRILRLQRFLILKRLNKILSSNLQDQ
jgi:malonyl CoA-acyl carrier protein transacylase